MRWMLSFVLLAPAAPAFASTATRASLPELVSESELVVLGTAGQPTSAWEGGRIVTHVPVSVDEVWAGELSDPVVEVVTLGGVVDDIGQNVSGAPRVRRGQRVVLCLQRRAGRLRVVEMSQGAFFVLPEPTADPSVRRRSFGMRLLGPIVAPMPTTLRALERAVREADDARR